MARAQHPRLSVSPSNRAFRVDCHANRVRRFPARNDERHCQCAWLVNGGDLRIVHYWIRLFPVQTEEQTGANSMKRARRRRIRGANPTFPTYSTYPTFPTFPRKRPRNWPHLGGKSAVSSCVGHRLAARRNEDYRLSPGAAGWGRMGARFVFGTQPARPAAVRIRTKPSCSAPVLTMLASGRTKRV